MLIEMVDPRTTRGSSLSASSTFWTFLLLTFMKGQTAHADINQFKTFGARDSSPLPISDCPPCELLFGKLENSPGGGGRLFQHVDIQERGEPKSGTGFMFEWATTALAHACIYLQRAYGRHTCRIEWTFSNRTLIFEPYLAATDEERPCQCDTIDSVVIGIYNHDIHTLPVHENCTWFHRNGISSQKDVCTTVDGVLTKSAEGLWRCMQTANCQTLDNRQQMAVLRDPRAVVVSTYYHMLRNRPSVPFDNVDDFVLAYLPTTCKWVTIRYLLFEGMLADHSSIYWYEDAKSNPTEWHRKFFYQAGLHFPHEVVEEAVEAVDGENSLGFPSKGVDTHDGGNTNVERSFRNELRQSTVSKLDDVLRLWLPPVLLAKLGVP